MQRVGKQILITFSTLASNIYIYIYFYFFFLYFLFYLQLIESEKKKKNCCLKYGQAYKWHSLAKHITRVCRFIEISTGSTVKTVGGTELKDHVGPSIQYYDLKRSQIHLGLTIITHTPF
jgi:hypothetical protein